MERSLIKNKDKKKIYVYTFKVFFKGRVFPSRQLLLLPSDKEKHLLDMTKDMVTEKDIAGFWLESFNINMYRNRNIDYAVIKKRRLLSFFISFFKISIR